MADAPPRFITPEGFARLRAEYDALFGVERPKVVEVVSWAASLGDRSENADYLYGKRRLREIDRRLSHLARIMKAAKVVDPPLRPPATRSASEPRSSWPMTTIIAGPLRSSATTKRTPP